MGGRGASSATSRTAPTPEIRAVLALVDEGKLSIEADYTTDGKKVDVIVTGDTYENREAIKAAGFAWDRLHGMWRYQASPSMNDPVLMAFAKERTISKIEWSKHLASMTPERLKAEYEADLTSRPSHIGRRRKEMARRGR